MEVNNRILVLDDEINASSVIDKIVKNGRQEAFCVCDVSEMVRKNVEWKKYFPEISLFYAMKCNDTRLVLETQAALGVGFSCSNKEEISKILSLGVSPDKIILSNPAKKICHLAYAAKVGIKLTTFDNEEELHKIKKYHPSANLILTIDVNRTETDIVDRKFGVLSEEEIKSILIVAKFLKLNVIGVSFRIESGCENFEGHEKAIKIANSVFSTASLLGYDFTLMDITGIFQGNMDSSCKISEVLYEALNNNFPSNTAVIAEVGRFCVETAFKTISCIHSKRKLKDNTTMYYLDVGVYNGLSSLYYKRSLVGTPLKNHFNSPAYPSVLWGPTCDSLDVITKDLDYYPELEIGEWIIFHDTGAYTIPISYKFNGFDRPNIFYYVRKSDWLLLTEKGLPKNSFENGNSVDNYLIWLNAPNNTKPYYY